MMSKDDDLKWEDFPCAHFFNILKFLFAIRLWKRILCYRKLRISRDEVSKKPKRKLEIEEGCLMSFL